MVIAGKIFRIVEDMDIEEISEKLRGFRRSFTDPETGIELITEIEDLKFTDQRLHAVLAEDLLIFRFYRGKTIPHPVTVKNRVVFVKPKDGEKPLLLVVGKKRRANNVASKLSEIIFIRQGGIVEAEISHEVLKALHESDPEATKVIFFDNVDLPNVDKLSLYGTSLANTALYTEYLKHGKIWYVVFKSANKNMTIGLTRNCVITVFNPISEDVFVEFVLNEIIPLVNI